MSCSLVGAPQRQDFMELAARGEFGRCLAVPHRDVLKPVIAKHALDRLNDVLKDNLRRRLVGRFYSHLEVFFAGLNQLDAPGLFVLQLEDEGRQRHLAYMNESRLAPFHLKTAEGRSAGAGVRVETNAVAEVVSNEGLNVVGEDCEQHAVRQHAVGHGPHRVVDRFQDDPVFVHMLPPVTAHECQHQALGAAIGIENAVFQRGKGLENPRAKLVRESLAPVLKITGSICSRPASFSLTRIASTLG